MARQAFSTVEEQERAFLVGIELESEEQLLDLESSLQELSLLAETAGLEIIGRASQRLKRRNAKTLIGKGKVNEVKDLAEDGLADVILFDDELSPRHQRELERAFGDSMRIVDRTALILDIFAQHAKTREGSLQVELAQYEYRLPRLTRAWTHLARQAGGGGGRAGGVGGVGLRGPGETQLEVDRRDIGRRITRLRKELEKVKRHRRSYRERRKGTSIPTVAIVGYTNAGKSTLLHTLAGADVLIADQLFATLDPTTRKVSLPGGGQILLTDTVGFIQKLPTQLVAAFRATLEEIQDADLLLHVVDITHRNARQQAEAVNQTLGEILQEDIPAITALNKTDLLENLESIEGAIDDFERATPVSARTGAGLDRLLAGIEAELYDTMEPVTVRIPYKFGNLVSAFHEHGLVENIQHSESHVIIDGRLPYRFLSDFAPYQVDTSEQNGAGVIDKHGS